MSDELQKIWQDQAPDCLSISLKEVRARALKFQRRVHFRNIREYLAVVFIVVYFGWRAITLADPVKQAGCVLTIAGALYIAWHLYRWGSSKEVSGNFIEFHRRELERQRDLLRSIWRWYLGPLIPGLLMITLAGLRDSSPAHTRFVIVYMILCALLFYGIGMLNQRAARQLQKQIDELDRLAK